MPELDVSILIGAGLPVLFLWLSLGGAFIRMARRKGIHATVALIGAFPVWALFFGIWLAIQPNKQSSDFEDGENPNSA
jgi:hypothetical protein